MEATKVPMQQLWLVPHDQKGGYMKAVDIFIKENYDTNTIKELTVLLNQQGYKAPNGRTWTSPEVSVYCNKKLHLRKNKPFVKGKTAVVEEERSFARSIVNHKKLSDSTKIQILSELI